MNRMMHPIFGTTTDYIPGIDSCMPLEIQAQKFEPTKDENARKIEEFQITKEGILKKTTVMTIQLAYDKKLSEGVTLLHYSKLGVEDKMPLLKEVFRLRMLKHKNILEFYGTIHQAPVQKTYLSFETYECFLSQLLSDKHKKLLEPPVIKCVMQQLLTGLQYLHDINIVHRDISPKNIVFTEKGLLKISNFRSSLMLNERKRAIETVELCYQPLNVLMEDESFYTADDIWSATCIFAEMVLKKKLFESVETGDIIKDILFVLGFPDTSKWPEFTELPNCKYLSNELPPSNNWLGSFFKEKRSLDFVKQGLCYNPKLRISGEEFLLHLYFLEEPLAIDVKAFGLKLHGETYKFPIK